MSVNCNFYKKSQSAFDKYLFLIRVLMFSPFFIEIADVLSGVTERSRCSKLNPIGYKEIKEKIPN